MDLEKDKIVILHIKKFNETEESLFDSGIKNFCQQNNIKNTGIKIINNDGSSVGTQINSFINYEEVNINFVVIGQFQKN